MYKSESMGLLDHVTLTSEYQYMYVSILDY